MTNEQLDLTHHVRPSDPATSHAAVKVAARGAASVKADVLAALAAAGGSGLTRDELARVLPEHTATTVARRASDLIEDGHARVLYRSTGPYGRQLFEPVTRPTRTGCEAEVLEATWSGHRNAAPWTRAHPSVLLANEAAARNHAIDARDLACLDRGCGHVAVSVRSRLAHARDVHGFRTLDHPTSTGTDEDGYDYDDPEDTP